MSVTWIYGEPCSGKSELLKSYEGIKFDSHSVREIAGCWDLSNLGRDVNIRNLAAIASVVSDQGHSVIVAAVTPKREHREFIRKIIPDVEFVLAQFDMDNIDARQRERFGSDYHDSGFEYDIS